MIKYLFDTTAVASFKDLTPFFTNEPGLLQIVNTTDSFW